MGSKRKKSGWLTAVIVLLAIVLVSFVPAAADEYDEDGNALYYPETNEITGWPSAQAVYGETCFLMDADSGAVLCSLKGDTTRFPASTTKIMTALLTVENCSLTETVTMTEEGVREVTAGDSSNAGTSVGEQFTVEQCLYMLLLKSANDIANQLAVHVGGSISGFADMMNARAVELGCTGTHFHNASGMPDEEHYTTAHDLARIMQAVLQNETLRGIIGTFSYSVPATDHSDSRYYENHNSLINKDSEYYYDCCIGGKTGFTNAAQRTLVTAAQRDGHTLICVTMRTPDKSDYYDQKRLYNYGFDNFQWVDVAGGTIVLPNGVDPAPFKSMFGSYIDPYAADEAPADPAADAADGNADELTIEAPEPVAAEGDQETGTGVVGAAGTASDTEEVSAQQSSVPISKTVESGTPGYSAVETDNGDGTVSIRFYYQGIEVGASELVKPTPTPAPAAEVPEAAPVESGTAEPADVIRVYPVVILGGLFAGSLLILGILLLIEWRKILQERREEEKSAKREIRRREQEEAWEGVEYEDEDSEDWNEPEGDPVSASAQAREAHKLKQAGKAPASADRDAAAGQKEAVGSDKKAVRGEKSDVRSGRAAGGHDKKAVRSEKPDVRSGNEAVGSDKEAVRSKKSDEAVKESSEKEVDDGGQSSDEDR